MLRELENGTWRRTYEYLNGELLATIHNNPWVRKYNWRDHLGTLRVRTGEGSGVHPRHDFYPLGGEHNSTPTSETHKFTGQERDPETGLDYFIARH